MMNLKHLSLMDLSLKMVETSTCQETCKDMELEYYQIVEEIKRRDKLNCLTYDQIVESFVE